MFSRTLKNKIVILTTLKKGVCMVKKSSCTRYMHSTSTNIKCSHNILEPATQIDFDDIQRAMGMYLYTCINMYPISIYIIASQCVAD